jgi:DNA polymerase (family X)
MANLDVAYLLYEMADLMEFRGEDPFKTRAYRRAADSIAALPEEIRQVAGQGRLLSVEGIGRSIGEKVTEILATGTCAYLEELRQAIPPGLREVTRVPGIGPRTAFTLFSRMGIRSLEELEAAARDGRLRAIPGFGAKESQVLGALERVQERRERVPLAAVLPLAEAVLRHMRQSPDLVEIAVVGSVRRRRETVADLDLLCAAQDPSALIRHFLRIPLGGEVLRQEEDGAAVSTSLGRRIDLQAVPPDRYAAALLRATGSKAHYAQLEERARQLGLAAADGGGPAGTGWGDAGERAASEAALYRLLRLPYIPPELREGSGEIEAAADGRLPMLISRADLKGDLHAHSRWSDGTATIAEMAEAARALGHRYLAITDHTQSLAIANGLSPERVRRQAAEIAALNRGFGSSFRVLHGTEVDILKDGTLDLPDDLLAELDVVVASVHSHFRMSEEEMTERMARAIINPHVDVIGHPTGRLLTRRDPYPVDMERLLRLAAATGTAMEINCSPDRLDLTDAHVRLAKELGVRIAVNTDAHSVPELDLLEFGIGQARRGWLEAADVLNALGPDDLSRWLKREKG